RVSRAAHHCSRCPGELFSLLLGLTRYSCGRYRTVRTGIPERGQKRCEKRHKRERCQLREDHNMIGFIKAIRWILPFAVAAFPTFVLAQETMGQTPQSVGGPHTTKQELSELEKGNLSRVAASPAQVKQVLIQDPGLLVELKRWIAKEATDNGQIVADEDLTDNAVFDRLSTDIAFRSVATRLVQRYGYLRPNVNPDSEMGKEQDLLIKERVRRLVRIEDQEDTDSVKSPKNDAREAKTGPCDANKAGECGPSSSARPGRTGSVPDPSAPQKEFVPGYPNDGQPVS